MSGMGVGVRMGVGVWLGWGFGGGVCIEDVVDSVMDHMLDFFLLIDHDLWGV